MDYISPAIRDDFAAVNRLVIERLHSDVPLVESIGQYIVEGGGKRMRPLITLLCARALGYPGTQHVELAAVIEFLWDGWRPHFAVMGRVNGIRGYHDIKRYPDARLVPGLVLFRWDAPLFFANAELFRERVLQAVADSPTPVRRIIVSAEPVTSVDVTSADVLAEMVQTMRQSGIELHFAEMKDPVKDKLERFELMQHFGPGVFHPTLGAAVDDYLADHAVDWQP